MKRLLYVVLLCSLGLSACGSKEITTVAPLPTLSPVDRQTRVLEALYADVNDQFLYPDFGGADWGTLHAEYQDKIKGGLSNADFETAMAALVGNLPGGSATYETRAERIDQELQNTSLYSGIGAYVSIRSLPQPHVVIMAIIPDSPAQQAGLKPHDSIYAIDGQAVTAAEGLDVVRRVRGEAGTTVTLEVGSPNGFRHTVKVQRARLSAADSLEVGLVSNTGVVYLRFPVTADTNLLTRMGQIMQTIESRGNVGGLVLDFRVSRASGDWPLAELLTLFGDGPLGEFYTRKDENPVSVKGVDLGGSQKLPLVILVGPDTEGQSEIFAAALQEASRATVIGLPTSGKIFGYTSLPLPDGSRLTIAVSSYKTQSGRDLGITGVKPDEVLNNDWDQVEDGSDPLIDRAVEIILKR